ncbi:MAG: zinc-binding alcohol dehydrogenase [Pseudomonadota bacterium]
MVFRGAIPETEWVRMRAPFQAGSFHFPVKYGYCTVAQVEKGPPELEGGVAFCLHPHQDRFVVPVSTLVPIPREIPAKRATLAANMETALNAHWDAFTQAGDRIIVIGAGIVGLLTAYLASRMPGTDVTLIDVTDSRRDVAEHLRIKFATPSDIPGDADVVFHTSASEDGLRTAITAAGDEGRIVEVSWFATRDVGLTLGGAFHSRRLSLISSQVGRVPPHRRARWSNVRRLQTAISLLADPLLDVLVEQEIAFRDAPDLLPKALTESASELPPVIRYEAADV